MPYFSYVLKNSVSGKFYKGHCQNLEIRLNEHLSGKTKTTSHEHKSWFVAYFETFESREEAIRRERYFKTAAGRRFLKSKNII